MYKHKNTAPSFISARPVGAIICAGETLHCWHGHNAENEVFLQLLI